MTVSKLVIAGTAAFGLGVLAFFLALGVTSLVVTLAFDWADDINREAGVFLSGLTLILAWTAALGAAMFGARKASAWLAIEPTGVCVVAALFAGAAFYWSLQIVSETNACLWDVGFPLGAECWAR